MTIRRFMLRVALGGALTAAQATAVSAAVVCGEARTTVDLAQCLSARVAEAEQRLADYLAAARLRLDDLPGHGQIDLFGTQAAWLEYRSRQCGDIYTLWADGTARYEKSGRCMLELTRERTHDVWSQYLVPDGGGTAALPEP